MRIPRIMIAGLRGGSGKTLLSAGIAAALRGRGRKVAPYKKGPDYIDAAWLGRAAEAPCRNLDLFIMPSGAILGSMARAAGSDVAVIEANRGLHDGADAQGTCSSAELAKLLKAPVVLAVDCTKVTRTVAALVLGARMLDREVDLKGVILNRAAGKRHEKVIREAVAKECDLPVLGVIPRLPKGPFPERHLGLVPPQERSDVPKAIAAAARIVEKHVDLQAIEKIADGAPELEAQAPGQEEVAPKVRIGVFRDAAFQFYYPENLEALRRAGAEIIEISPLEDEYLEEVDALYVGGGFPEVFVERLAANGPFLRDLRSAIRRGMPAYAECGGLMYLGEQLVVKKKEYPMAGVLPAVFGMEKLPQGHGYSVVKTAGANPFFKEGTLFRGHEFHYSRLLEYRENEVSFAFRVERGKGIDGTRDGMCSGSVLAAYAHVHALGSPEWAGAIVEAAERFRR